MSKWIEHLDGDIDAGAPRPHYLYDSYSRPTVPGVEDFQNVGYSGGSGDTGQSTNEKGASSGNDEDSENEDEEENKYGNDNENKVGAGNGPDVFIKELVQFLMKTPPPPTSYMSMPDPNSDDDNEHANNSSNPWNKFKTRILLRHRRPRPPPRAKRARSSPPLIMLPDSAVAATSTDGHRYIEISIPVEHSPLAAEPRLLEARVTYPAIDAAFEAGFQREINARFGMWKKSPASRVVTVLNPVAEDYRESMSAAVQTTATMTAFASGSRPGYPMRVRPHTVSLLPSREQRYTPKKVTTDLGKSKSFNNGRRTSDTFVVVAPSQNRGGDEEQQNNTQALLRRTATTTSEYGWGRKPEELPSSPGPFDRDGTSAAESSASANASLQNPVIKLTLPPQVLNGQGKEVVEDDHHHGPDSSSSPSDRSTNSNNGTGNGNGNYNNSSGGLGGLGSGSSIRADPLRSSFAASIDTASSSPQLLKAQTAIACQPVAVPIVVRPPIPVVGAHNNTPLPEPGRFNVDRAVQTSSPFSSASTVGLDHTIISGPPPKSSARQIRAQEKAQDEEPATPSQSLGFMPGLTTTTSPNRGRHIERSTLTISSSDYTTSSSSSQSSPSTLSPPNPPRRGRSREGAQYIAQALSESRGTLESLPVRELVSRYESLRERRVYERERRLRRLERSRDAWVRAVPSLLRDMNGLLREQRRFLENCANEYTTSASASASAGRRFFSPFSSPSFASPTRAPPPPPPTMTPPTMREMIAGPPPSLPLSEQQQQQHFDRRRSRSVEPLPVLRAMGP